MDSRLEKLQSALTAATEGMSTDEVTWHPQGKWSAAEILEHLYLTYAGTTKGFERVAAAGKPLASPANMRQRARSFVAVGLGYIPEGRKSPAAVVPRGLPPEKVRAEVCEKITVMDEVIAGCESRFGSRVKLLDHPILGPLTAAQWRKFHLAHGLHHVRQIHRLREALASQKT
jgi:DinB superfamily